MLKGYQLIVLLPYSLAKAVRESEKTMKKQITFEISEKPQFDNDMDILATVKFLHKLEQAVKLYNKHSKALKEYLVRNDITDFNLDGYHAHISTGTARRAVNNEKLQEFLKEQGTDIENFKELGNPPKSLEIYRD